jgi:hypothetical protein
MKNKERQSYRLFIDRRREIVLRYLQVRLAVFLEPQFIDINAKIDGRNSFSVTGVVNVEIESFKNPVTREDSNLSKQKDEGGFIILTFILC